MHFSVLGMSSSSAACCWAVLLLSCLQIQHCSSFMTMPRTLLHDQVLLKNDYNNLQQKSPTAGQRLGASSTTKTSTTTTALSMAASRPPVIENWKLLSNGRLVGLIKNHPSIPDGETITTSRLAKPEIAGKGKLVSTGSGSQYTLGKPASQLGGSKNNKNNNKKSGVNGEDDGSGESAASLQELKRRARVEKDLSGEVIGDDTRQYLIAGKPSKSTSGKSKIYKAYLSNSDGLPEGEAVTVKISANWEALEREASNYNRITKGGFTRGQFVFLYDYWPTASVITKKFQKDAAIVVERGSVDLKKYIAINGRLEGKELRDAAAAAAQCIQAVHDSGLVWTDLKTENFVVTQDGQVKGIDLESAMPKRDNPVDYSPEATPPEFAKSFLQGDGPYFVLQPNYDMWSFGMLLYELSTGSGFWDGKTPVQITKALRDMSENVNLDDIEDIDPKLKDLISQCLDLNPRKRPNIVRVLLHPYFISTGIGPFSLFPF